MPQFGGRCILRFNDPARLWGRRRRECSKHSSEFAVSVVVLLFVSSPGIRAEVV